MATTFAFLKVWAVDLASGGNGTGSGSFTDTFATESASDPPFLWITLTLQGTTVVAVTDMGVGATQYTNLLLPTTTSGLPTADNACADGVFPSSAGYNFSIPSSLARILANLGDTSTVANLSYTTHLVLTTPFGVYTTNNFEAGVTQTPPPMPAWEQTLITAAIVVGLVFVAGAALVFFGKSESKKRAAAAAPHTTTGTTQ